MSATVTAALRDVVRRALAEDLAAGPDVTTRATIAPETRLSAAVVPRAAGRLAGLEAVEVTLAELTDSAEVDPRAADGDAVEPGRPVAVVTAPAQALLTAERTLLNLLTHLSGIATVTAEWAQALAGAGTGTRVRDTRKTLPGLRVLEKYAVTCGGGLNHRMGLGDAALIKDNHIAAAGGVTHALGLVRAAAPDIPVEIEVDTLAQFDEVLPLAPEQILLDNFTPAQVAEAVTRRDRAGATGKVLLEASGGITLARAAEYAATGVDFIAAGALTHSAPALDLGLDLLP
ncbi:carboxylating nicotinate-nucleotide diphosphorylase [Corynebacterium frankenforstense]